MRPGKHPGSSKEQPYLRAGSRTGPSHQGHTEPGKLETPILTLRLQHSDFYMERLCVCICQSSANTRSPGDMCTLRLEVGVMERHHVPTTEKK